MAVSMWKDVKVDDQIVDRNGEAWRVAAIDMTEAEPGYTGAFRCVNAQEEWLTIATKPGGNPVTILDQPEPIALLRDQLGVTVIAVQDHATKAVTCEAWPEKPPSKNLDAWKFHIEEMHHVIVEGVKGYAKLVELHDLKHDEGRFYIEHTHG